jgi:SAM-dependent methyltransferase
MSATPRLLNLGCGRTLHPAWVNLDANPVLPGVQRADLARGIPFGDASFDAVYHSHVLEHLERADAARLLAECRRVLRPGGLLRICVPDLEGIARAYLEALDRRRQAAPGGAEAHEWMQLELLDQLARSESGGDMQRFLHRHPRHDFVRSRIGDEADTALCEGARPWHQRLSLAGLSGRLRRMLAAVPLFLLGGRRFLAEFRAGHFVMAGERHRWMYDEYGLRAALETAGFTSIVRCRADESAIPGFAAYELDVRDGHPRKPDSLYMEAVAP